MYFTTGSEEELQDLKKCYMQYEGDLNKISESFLSYNVNDEDQYRNIILDLIRKGELPDYPQFTREAKSKKDARIKRVSASKFFILLMLKVHSEIIVSSPIMANPRKKICNAYLLVYISCFLKPKLWTNFNM